MDARSDIFSFGVMLYELLTGARPFGGKTEIAAMRAVVDFAPEPPRKLTPEIPALLESIDDDREAPEKRYQTARQLCADLRWALDELSVKDRASAAMLEMRRARRRRLAVYTAAVAALVLALGFIPAVHDTVLSRLPGNGSAIGGSGNEYDDYRLGQWRFNK